MFFLARNAAAAFNFLITTLHVSKLTMFLPCLWAESSRQHPPEVLISLYSKATFFK